MSQDHNKTVDFCVCVFEKSEVKKTKKKFRFFPRGKSNHEGEEKSDSPGICPKCGKPVNQTVPCRAHEYQEAKLRRESLLAIRETGARGSTYTTYPEEELESVDERPVCNCPSCRRERGEPLTVELLPMDAQVSLQTMAQDSLLFCEIL
ncbi:uncharacterized protein LOC111085607 [Limulus polyphemus]|uniref:Uncharacterized protein LOC111085607 n=1 Tax=Limulus polyphemus TaxID=6850 RepID=A0ABM1SAR1_LIMPO|nr:uncharacterized protein LOC111085607 [Limulus polyphemus]